MTRNFKKTDKQKEAIQILAGIAKYIMLYGGSRSGKTLIILYAIIIRASKVKSRHLAVRLHFNHIKTSVWMDTLPKLLALCFPDLTGGVRWDNVNYRLVFPNESELWIAGLDEKLRTEKILGQEYSSIFFNECSHIPYSSATKAMTRLAEKNDLTKKAYFDENPPAKSHWSYSLFFLNKDPVDWTDKKTELYEYLLMNPEDNRDNIDESYIDEILEGLPQKEKDRFKHGIFSDGEEGAIYYAFNKDNHVRKFDRENIPVKLGMDFNVSPGAAVCAEVYNNTIWIFDEIYQKSNSNTYKMADEIVERFPNEPVSVVPDSTGSANKTSSKKTDHQILRSKDSITVLSSHNPFKEDRYNCVNGLFDENRLFIHPRCRHLIRDLEGFTHDTNLKSEDGKMISHISDAMGYLAWKMFPLRKTKKPATVQYY